MTTAAFIKRVFLVPVVLLAALVQILRLTTCNVEEASGRPVKIITLSNIPDSFEISPAVKTQLSRYNNPLVRFRQEGGEPCIETDGLYILALFIPELTEDQLKAFITSGVLPEEDVLDKGAAYALIKIGKTATQRIVTLSANIDELGYYWTDDGMGDAYSICTMLITPDARFILRIDFSINLYAKAKSEFTLDYNLAGRSIADLVDPNLDLITVFTVVRKKGSDTVFDSNSAYTLMPENFIEYLVERFS
jgi:hypothetical protein